MSCAPSSKLEQQPTALTMEPIAAEGIQHQEESVVFGCPVEGCIKFTKVATTFSNTLMLGDSFLLALERERERVHVQRDKEKVDRDVQVNFW